MKVGGGGGGIIGCATAYELARAGCAVTLLERTTPGSEASGVAAGLLSALGEVSGSHIQGLAVASWRLYPVVATELRERTGIDVEHVTRGTIYPLYTVMTEWIVTGRPSLDMTDFLPQRFLKG